MKIFYFLLVLVLVGCDTETTKRDRLFIQGNQALQKREYDLAVDYFTRALTYDQDFESAYNNRGVAYMEDGRAHEAILDYDKAISINGNYYEAIFNRAYAYESVGRIEDALLDVKTLKKEFEDSAFVIFYEGLLRTKNRQYDSAMICFKIAKSFDPQNLEADINIATLFHFKQQYDSAEYLLKEVLKRDMNQVNALNTLSQIYMAKNDFQNALITVNQALNLEPLEPFFLNNRGQIYLEMDSLELGVKDINKSILREPKNPWAYRNKGIYYLKKGEADQAIRLFEEALKSGDFIDEIYVYLGNAHQMLQKNTKACEYWQFGVEKGESACSEQLQQFCQ